MCIYSQNTTLLPFNQHRKPYESLPAHPSGQVRLADSRRTTIIMPPKVAGAVKGRPKGTSRGDASSEVRAMKWDRKSYPSPPNLYLHPSHIGQTSSL